MLALLIEPFNKEGIDITTIPITRDRSLYRLNYRCELHLLGFKKIIYACKGNYTFKICGKKQKASVLTKRAPIENRTMGD